MRSQLLVGAISLCAAILTAGCKGKAFDLTPAQEIRVGTAAIRSLEIKNPPTALSARRVARVGSPLSLAKGKRKVLYSFHALDLPQNTALSLPGGPVAISQTLLDNVNDEQLLALLAHEMGHIENDDFAALYHRGKDALFVTGYITGGLSLMELASDEKLVKRWALTPGWSQQEEIAADQTAMELLEKAGKSPELLLNLLESPPVEALKPDPVRLEKAKAHGERLR